MRRFRRAFAAAAVVVALAASGCSRPARVGAAAPPIAAESWINVEGEEPPALAGRLLLVTFLSPT